MADAKKAEAAEGAEAPAAPKKKKLLLFIIIGVVVLVLGGGGAAFFLMKKGDQGGEEGADGEETSAKAHKPKKKDGKEQPPVFVKLDPFTVKLQSEAGDSYLQTTPELRVLDVPIGDRVKQYSPEIRHRVLLILSSKKAADIGNPQGVQQLSNEIRVTINRIIDGPKEAGKGKKKAAAADAPATFPDDADPEDSVQAVLFTSFIVQ